MKINRIFLLGLVGPFVIICILFSGCDEIVVGNKFLSQPPSIDYPADSVFSSQENVEQLLWNTYATLPYGLGTWPDDDVLPRSLFWKRGTTVALTDIASDFGSSAVANGYYSGNLNPSSGNNQFSYKFRTGLHWKAFFQGWTIVENVDKVPDIDQETKDRIKAEAKMIMAIHYTEMFRYIGGVPWINHAYKPDEELTVPRLTAEASVDSIATLIDEAKEGLPTELNNVSQWKGRMTKAGAAGLKARLLLFAASPLYNSSQPYMNGEAASKEIVWMGEYKPELWERARDAAKETIDIIESSAYYGLEHPMNQDSVSYREAFRRGYFNRESGETLISSRLHFEFPNARLSSFWVFITKKPWPNYDAPTHTFAQMFPDENGVPIEKSSLYDPAHPYQNRDPRFYETLTSNISMWGNRPAEMWIGGRERQEEKYGPAWAGYNIRKFVFNKNEVVGEPIHWPYLRVPEIYLSYAEALNEINGSPTAEAFKYINKVRNKVGLDDLQTVMENPSSQEEFRQAILKERALELAYENVRWFDLVRWKRKDIFTKELIGLNLYKNSDGTYRYEEFSVSDAAPRHWQNNFSPKWYLSPIQVQEINKEYGMIQNPGWGLTGN